MDENERVPCQLYLLTPPKIDDLDAFLTELDRALSAAPVACLQIRLKDMSGSDLIQASKAILDTTRAYDTVVLVNDDPQLAVDIGADGVHLGQDDMSYDKARKLLPERAIIGITCHNSRELAFTAANSGADYVAFGAFFDTPTKQPKTRAELEILSWWQDTVEVPCVAIGGITVSNAKAVIEAGADFIAVSSGVWAHPDGPAAAVKAFSDLF